MSHITRSRIETIGSVDSGDLESIASVSSHDGNTIQPENLPATQEESTVPGDGFASSIRAICFEQCYNTRQTWQGSCCSKIKAFFVCIMLPFYVLFIPFFRSRSTRRKVTHHGIVYFYVLMASNIVFNLWEQQVKKDYFSLSYKFLLYFEATIMVLALLAMAYIASATRGKVRWNVHEANLIFYLRAGLYVFGIASMVYTALNIYNNFSCNDGRHIVLNIAKFLFIVLQILFHNYYYQAKLPSGGCLIQVALAHILGTNLSLWIWTICQEVYKPEDNLPSNFTKNCTPINLHHTEKYFYPFFVEYLLLVASMIYELWINLDVPAGARRLPRQDWLRETYQEQLESGRQTVSIRSGVSHPIHLVSSRRRRKFAPSLAFTFVLGLALSSIFIAFLLAANSSGREDEKWYNNYIIANICLNFTQICACYVTKVCSQSQPANRERSSLNLDDALLYFGLAGITLWEGFHFYGLLFDSHREPIHFVHGMLSLIEDITQTVILVSVRRLSSREDKNANTITNMALLLLATNFALWIQNSFYIGQQLENPGEHHKTLEDRLGTFANILNPIIIFFRFHSATCCYQMWVIFSHKKVVEN